METQELNASSNFYDFYRNCYDSDANYVLHSLRGAVQISQQENNVLVFFICKPSTPLTHKICLFLQKHDIPSTCIFVAWDITDASASLQSSCWTHLDFNDTIVNLIRDQQTALFLISASRNGRISVIYQIDDAGFDEDIVQSVLGNKMCIMSEDTKEDINSKVEDLNEEQIIKMPEVSFELFDFTEYKQTTLKYAVKRALETEVPLLLYVHRSESAFSRDFYNFWSNDNCRILFKEVSFFAWDYWNVDVDGDLRRLAENYSALKVIENNDQCCLYIFLYDYKKCTLEMKEVYQCLGNIYVFSVVLRTVIDDFLDQVSKHNELMEKDAILAFKVLNTSQFLDVQVITLANAVESSFLCDLPEDRRMIILYIHNRYERDVTKLDNALCALEEKLQTTFVLVPWEVSGDTNRSVLSAAVVKHLDCPLAEMAVQNRRSQIFVYAGKCDENGKKITLESHYDAQTKFSLRDNLEILESIFAEQNSLTVPAEIEAIKDLRRKLSFQFVITIPLMPLDKVVQELCLCHPVQLRRIMVLYLQSSNSSPLAEELSNLFQRNEGYRKRCVVVGWDVSKRERNVVLGKSIERQFGCHILADLVRSGDEGVFIFIPTSECLALYARVSSRSKLADKLEDARVHFLKELDVESEIPNMDKHGAVEFQQLVCNYLSNRDFDCFNLNTPQEDQALRDKIYFAYFGQRQELEGEEKDQKMRGRRQEMVSKAYNKIVEQSKNYNACKGEVIISIVYNCITPLPEEKLKKILENRDYNPHLDFFMVPVFILRKCFNTNRTNQCRIFIDNGLRVYDNWNSYLEDNKLPKGLFVVPRNGKYTSNRYGAVNLQYKLSPASDISKAVLQGLDIGTSIVGLAAGAGAVACEMAAVAAFTGPAAPIVLTGIVLSTGVYGIGRSIQTLVDRAKHDEDMSFLDSEARNAYLSIAAGALGFTAAGARAALSTAAKVGVGIGSGTEAFVNGVQIAAVTVSGTSLGNSAFTMIADSVENNSAPDALAVVQLSMSVLFFGHSLYNFRLAGNITRAAQIEGLQEVRDGLPKNQQKIVNRLLNEATRSGNERRGYADVLTYLRNVDDDALRILGNMKKTIDANNVRLRLINGVLHFNDQPVTLRDFASMPAADQKTVISNAGSSTSSSSNVNLNSHTMKHVFNTNTGSSLSTSSVNIDAVLKFSQLAINLFSSGTFDIEQTVRLMISKFSLSVQAIIMDYATQCLGAVARHFDKSPIDLVLPNCNFPIIIVEKILSYFEQQVDENKTLKERIRIIQTLIIMSQMSVTNLVRYIIDKSVNWIVDLVKQKLVEREAEQRRRESSKQKRSCSICCGEYYY